MMDAGPSDAGLSLADARRLIGAAVRPVGDVERVAPRAALDRVLAHPLVAPVDVPAHDNAAMDGYALASRAVNALPRRYRVIGEARAGHPYAGRVDDDACVRILTGAVMPDDCDAVVAQETVQRDGDAIVVARPVPAGQHRRCAGEDLRAGSTVLERGRRLTAADLGLAASIGATSLDVLRRPRVAVFSTGNELRDVDEPLTRGSVRDANRHTIIAMLERLGVVAIDLGIVGDDPAALEQALHRACGGSVRADAIVTSGGMSTGDADHTRDVMQRSGDVAFWKLASKPGRPMAFGTIAAGAHRALLFGLPGNPVAVMVVFYALVRDALLALMGATATSLPVIDAICDAPIDKARGRSEFVRGIAVRTDTHWHVRPTAAQGSGVLRSMSEANCLIALDHDRGAVAIGDAVPVWLFQGLV